MQVPLEIAFHNAEHSDWAENEIRNHVARLEDIYKRLTSCRVRVDQRANNAQQSIPPVVRIEIGLPGHKDIVVSHEPEHLLRKYQRPDLHKAINEAFRIAERQLSAFKERMSNHTAGLNHEASNEFLGQIADILPERDHGFLMTKEGGMLYFHRNAVLVGSFDRLKRGDAVSYVEETGDTGPIATKVRVKVGPNGSGG
ncbi:HPF/RaiA family ribosome-associated protein [Pseudorhodoplanes sp.]|uniref:HPF/RaiA family ribosome-associated protein n=1 Tax=Pseudorhodoplanes sp. TaxID=1934341 RepID=UPI002C925DA0|nr:HPF/RaiA family ribosome-associated protein [Pseudorhodoplanes sp.]HWV53441.1 HPF/RaiA family ribosome-associated protein [Pseudorhodoplanes sp.]